MAVKFGDIVLYLEAIANNPQDKRSVDDSLHGRFWLKDAQAQNVNRDQFVAGNVPNEDCKGAQIPIVSDDPTQCAFYQALINKTGVCSLGQMPRQGPWITDAGYTVTLSTGVTITGAEIAANIEWWLKNGMPA